MTFDIWKNVTPLFLSEFTGCKDEDALISQYKVAQNDNQTLVIAGIVFNDDFDYVGNGDDKKMPDLDYKIRMDSREVVDLTQFLSTPYPMPPGPGRLFSKYLWSWDRSLERKNGILLPKLFWPTVRKICSGDR